MRRRVALSAVTILSIVTLPLSAISNPVIAGTIAGVELCPQFICGAAIFAGKFVGVVNAKPVAGVFTAAITHDPLPENAGETANITGGTWLIHIPSHTFAGFIAGGTLLNNGNNTFTVTLTMVLTQGGAGTLTFAGILNHNTFPPTIIGAVSQ
jgi:hypothetical protein